jgi:hypothetical protein
MKQKELEGIFEMIEAQAMMLGKLRGGARTAGI